MDYSFDDSLLRQDLMDYYGTAAFCGFPAAMMDVFAVQRMSTDELLMQAQKNGFRMDKYVSYEPQPFSSYEIELLLNAACAAGQASYVPAVNGGRSSKEDISFPTYETAVPDSYYQLSPESREIVVSRPSQWGYRLFAQELRSYAYQLGKLKKQNADNPYVQKIGKASEGRPLLYYIVGFSENLENAIKKAQKAAERELSDLNAVVRKAEEKKRPEMITEKTIQMMEPYRIFLGLYNDTALVEVPDEYRRVFSEIRKILKSLLSDCEMFYYDTGTELVKELDRGSHGPFSYRLNLHAFFTKKISDAVNSNIEALLNCKLVRKTII